VAHRLRVLFGCAALTLSAAAQAADWTAFIGTYTGPESRGIYSFRFDSASGKLTGPSLAVESSNPSFLAVHPNRRYLYAANENQNGSISAFVIDSGGLKAYEYCSVARRWSLPHRAGSHWQVAVRRQLRERQCGRFSHSRGWRPG
jgi:hypothetical protein